MSDTVYRIRQHVTFSADEFIAIGITSAIVALILSMRDLLFVHFGESASMQAAGLLFLFLLCILLIVIWICKIIAIRVGHVITYRAHVPGLFFGVVISVISLGYLPVFLPGGFVFDQPTRLLIGKWRGVHKGWEVGLIAGTFALVTMAMVMLLSPVYLASGADLYSQLMVASCLIAIFSCIPAPFLQGKSDGRSSDVYRFFHGSTFGLDVLYASKFWFIVLSITTLFFGGLTYLMTVLEVRTGILVYAFAFVLTLFAIWCYKQFFKQ